MERFLCIFYRIIRQAHKRCKICLVPQKWGEIRSVGGHAGPTSF